MLKYTTKRDRNGNRYTLHIDLINKTYKTDYNDSWNYSDYLTITKRDRARMVEELKKNGYSRTE